MRHLRPFLAVLFWVGCLVGFVFQSKEVCNEYFKYKTFTSTKMTIPTDLSTPALSVCHIYPLIVNKTDYLKYGFPKDGGYSDIHGKLTIKSIFDLTADGYDTIQTCARRRDGMWIFDWGGDMNHCTAEIVVTKYYMQEFICYMYSFRNMTTLNVRKLAHALNYQNTAYILILHDIPASPTVYTFAHPATELPLLSRNFGKQIDRQITLSGNHRPNKVFVTFRENKINRLPSPYVTKCTSDDKKAKEKCTRLCLIEGMKVINRFPHTEMTTEPVDLRHVTFEDLHTKNTYDTINSVHRQCNAKCHRDSCHSYFTTTNVHLHSEPDGLTHRLEFRVLIPDSPLIEITYKASVSLLDFLVYMCSSFGMWFGLSFSSLPQMFVKHCHIRRKENIRDRVDSLIQVVCQLQHQLNKLKQDTVDKTRI